jgi:cystathionine beta-lyase
VETSRALQREMGGAPRPRASECRLVELMESANYSAGRGSAFDGPLSGDVQAVETRIVSYNPAKKDPHGAASMPIYQTATFAQPSATEFGDYDYTRSGNPTRDAAQKILAEVDNGCAAYCFTTGMAAIMVVTRFAEAGQNIILSDDSYGGTYRLLAQVCSKQGVPVKYVDMSGADGPGNLAAAMNAQTALVMCESPTNPLMRVCPLRALADVAHSRGALFSVDNTLMTGLLVRPLDLGADFVVTSCTKFACGHSDTMAGVVAVRDPELAKRVYFYQNAEGTGLAPFDCWLLLRGIKTMPLRMERAQANAMRIARFLKSHPRVTSVRYAGLPDNPGGYDMHYVDNEAKGAGVVVCFTTGSYEYSTAVASAAAASGLFKITVSFGSVNSLISLPGDMSHASIPDEVKAAREFPTDIIRLSVGIECAGDLIEVLQQSLDTAAAAPAARL